MTSIERLRDSATRGCFPWATDAPEPSFRLAVHGHARFVLLELHVAPAVLGVFRGGLAAATHGCSPGTAGSVGFPNGIGSAIGRDGTVGRIGSRIRIGAVRHERAET